MFGERTHRQQTDALSVRPCQIKHHLWLICSVRTRVTVIKSKHTVRLGLQRVWVMMIANLMLDMLAVVRTLYVRIVTLSSATAVMSERWQHCGHV